MIDTTPRPFDPATGQVIYATPLEEAIDLILLTEAWERELRNLPSYAQATRQNKIEQIEEVHRDMRERIPAHVIRKARKVVREQNVK